MKVIATILEDRGDIGSIVEGEGKEAHLVAGLVWRTAGSRHHYRLTFSRSASWKGGGRSRGIGGGRQDINGVDELKKRLCPEEKPLRYLR